MNGELCFFNDCHKKVNERGKFCEEHDKKELAAAEALAAMLDKMEVRYEND